MKHLEEEDLILYYYREASDLAGMEAHLRSCAACRTELDCLERLLGAVSSAALPERGDGYGRAVWKQIRPHIASDRRFDPRWWALAAAVLLTASGAFLAGRFWSGSDGKPVAELHELSGERLLLLSLGEHLDRSQILLVDVANGGIPKDEEGREIARDLVASNRLYRQTAAQFGETGVASLLQELEPLLLEISHDEAEPGNQLERRIASKGILFKVRILRAGLRERTLPPSGKKL